MLDHWATTDGGPLLLLANRSPSDWQGSDNATPHHLSDYDRACQIDDWIGVIPVDAGEGLVLGSDPLAAA